MSTPENSMVARMFTPRAELRAAITAGGLLLVGMVLGWLGVPFGAAPVWASLAIGMVYGGRPAIDALRNLRFDIDVLMVVGAGLAAYIGHPGEGALLLFLFVLSGALEDLAMLRTEREVAALHKMMPEAAMVLRGGEWIEVPAESLAPGDRVKVRPGERVPADARVLSGETQMDQSAITGESMPRAVRAGDELYAGTINTDDPVEAEVLRPVRESSLQKILDLVTRAREQREPVQRLIDRLSEPYALGVLGVSTIVGLVWWLALGRPLLGDAERVGALYTAITLLIVASPCALIIATPTATLAAIARGARAGVLFKGGQSIDALASIRSVCFDKTGTLTFGRPRLYEVHPVAWSDGPEMLAIAAALEADSTHPIAVAIREAAVARSVSPAPVEAINHTTAKGIEGRHAGVPVRLGRYAYVEPLIPVCLRNRVKDVLARIQNRGHVAVVIARGEENGQTEESGQAAVLIMADAIRPGAETLVRELHALGVRPVRMLTGDNRLTAERVATGLGLDAFDAELLPEDKLRIVRSMKKDAGGPGVAVIGDGVNDAPSLAAADVSVAIGAIGADAALESADIVLLADDLGAIPWSVRLARRTRRTIVVNFALALGVIGIMAVLTVVGSLLGREVPLAVGVLAHEGGTVLVVLNSLLLLRVASPRGGPAPREAGVPLARTGEAGA
ncbi:MAG: cation-translocating P-type ATPase [Planctomycetota bacterium]|nr:cation-translocating P-type ATPase [Planctomycetota bacterium]